MYSCPCRNVPVWRCFGLSTASQMWPALYKIQWCSCTTKSTKAMCFWYKTIGHLNLLQSSWVPCGGKSDPSPLATKPFRFAQLRCSSIRWCWEFIHVGSPVVSVADQAASVSIVGDAHQPSMAMGCDSEQNVGHQHIGPSTTLSTMWGTTV